MDLPVYKIVFEDDGISGLIGISIVDEPANEHDFLTLSKEALKLRIANREKRILTGVVLIPNQKIYRENPEEGNHYILFDAPTIEKISQEFLKGDWTNNSWFNHDYNKKLKGNHLVESWIISDPLKDKAFGLGFKDLPVGTWMVSYKLSKEDWEKYIKTGKAKGFSIDALFSKKLIKNRKSKMFNKLIKLFKTIKMNKIVHEGKDLFVEAFEEGAKVTHVDAEGNEAPFINDSFTYEGKLYTTDSEGIIISILDEAELEDEEKENSEGEATLKDALIEIAKEEEEFKESLLDAVEDLVEEGEIEEDELVEVVMRLSKKRASFNKAIGLESLQKRVNFLEGKLSKQPANTKLGAVLNRRSTANKSAVDAIRSIINR